jgi:hypothetical protein
MKAQITRMMTAAAAIALIAVAIYVLRPGSPLLELSIAAMPPLKEFYALVDVNKLPNQDIDDQSLIYPTGTKR